MSKQSLNRVRTVSYRAGFDPSPLGLVLLLLGSVLLLDSVHGLGVMLLNALEVVVVMVLGLGRWSEVVGDLERARAAIVLALHRPAGLAQSGGGVDRLDWFAARWTEL